MTHRRRSPQFVERPANARQLAWLALRSAMQENVFVGPLLEDYEQQSALSPADRRLATELALGLVRRQATLDALLRPCMKRPRSQVEDDLWLLLQIGTYQLAFLESVPAHAAVDTTIQLAHWLGKSRWAGFANGVLRSVARLLTSEEAAMPAADALPLSPGRYRRLTKPVFADPGEDRVRWFAEAFSFPRWLSERWVGRYSGEDLLALGFWMNSPPRMTLRVNPLRVSRDDFLNALAAEQIAAGPGEHPQSARLEHSMRVASLPGYADGWFSVQDETAMWAATRLAPRPGSGFWISAPRPEPRRLIWPN